MVSETNLCGLEQSWLPDSQRWVASQFCSSGRENRTSTLTYTTIAMHIPSERSILNRIKKTAKEVAFIQRDQNEVTSLLTELREQLTPPHINLNLNLNLNLSLNLNFTHGIWPPK